MSSGRRKFAVRHPVVVDIGCSCRRPKLPFFFSSMPNPKLPRTPSYFSPSTITTTTTTTTGASHWGTSITGTTSTTSSPSHFDYASSPAFFAPQIPRRKPKSARIRPTTRKKENGSATTAAAAKNDAKKTNATKKKGLVEESVAVVKDSSDPYVDFKESMLQMIVEMEIYAWDDLRDLLHRFLALNSPYHHHLILQAFTEILNALFSSTTSAAAAAAAAAAAGSTSLHRRLR